jgi:hypothetical protein
MEQAGFSFDAALTGIPKTQLPAIPKRETADEFADRLKATLEDLPDDIELDTLLLTAGLDRLSLTGWHRARALEVLIGGPDPAFQSYTAEKLGNGALKLRYRRLPPMMPCPGYGDLECGRPTRAGVRCSLHADMEEEDLFDQP